MHALECSMQLRKTLVNLLRGAYLYQSRLNLVHIIKPAFFRIHFNTIPCIYVKISQALPILYVSLIKLQFFTSPVHDTCTVHFAFLNLIFLITGNVCKLCSFSLYSSSVPCYFHLIRDKYPQPSLNMHFISFHQQLKFHFYARW